MSKQHFFAAFVVGFIWTVSSLGIAKAGENDAIGPLAIERLEVARKGFETASTVRDMWIWSARVLDCELALSESIDARITAYENELRRTKSLEKKVVDGQKNETYTVAELMEAKFYRLNAKCKLAEEKAKKLQASK